MADLTKKLRADLATKYPAAPVTDLTTQYQRHLGQQGKRNGADTILYDGTDIQEEARNYLRDLADV